MERSSWTRRLLAGLAFGDSRARGAERADEAPGGSLNVLAVSDVVAGELYERFDPGRFTDVDLIVSCGDLPPEYLTFLTGALKAPLYYVSGNHDLRNELRRPDGCTNLHGRVLRYRGIRMVGLEGSRWYSGGPYQYTEAEMRRTIRWLRGSLRRSGGVDLLVTHAPPRGVHDREDRCHRGFECFRKFIRRYRPLYHLHGHIHADFRDSAERVTLLEGTRVVNTCGYTRFEMTYGRISK